MKRKLQLAICCLLLAVLCRPAWAVVYLTPEQALKQLFIDSDTVRPQRFEVDAAARKAISKELGYKFAAETVTFYVGRTKDKIDGYVLQDEQIGKTQPITFMTQIGIDGRIQALEVLAYRESQGQAIRYPRFREQFVGKGLSDPIKVKQDIKNISGATLSVRASTIVARRALILWNYFYRRGDAS